MQAFACVFLWSACKIMLLRRNPCRIPRKKSASGSVLSWLNVPKFRVLISSAPEFETRPQIGSAYSVVWLFSLSDATLRHYLSMEVGVVSGDDVNDLAAKIVEKTDTVAMKYAYLFPEKK